MNDRCSSPALYKLNLPGLLMIVREDFLLLLRLKNSIDLSSLRYYLFYKLHIGIYFHIVT